MIPHGETLCGRGFPFPAVEELRRLGHDVRTVQEAGRSGQGIDDEEVLADATADQRTVLTHKSSRLDLFKCKPSGKVIIKRKT
jgi:hypothetical protein